MVLVSFLPKRGFDSVQVVPAGAFDVLGCQIKPKPSSFCSCWRTFLCDGHYRGVEKFFKKMSCNGENPVANHGYNDPQKRWVFRYMQIEIGYPADLVTVLATAQLCSMSWLVSNLSSRIRRKTQSHLHDEFGAVKPFVRDEILYQAVPCGLLSLLLPFTWMTLADGIEESTTTALCRKDYLCYSFWVVIRQIKAIMAKFIQCTKMQLTAITVVNFKIKNCYCADGTVTNLTTPQVMFWNTRTCWQDSWVAVRPSGTEPKIRVLHCELIGNQLEECRLKIAFIEAEINAFNKIYKDKPISSFFFSYQI